MDDELAEVRLWIVNRIADVLVDLADDGEEDIDDVDELHDQLKNVGNLICDAIDLKIVARNGNRATIEVGDPA